jgi:cobyrinic acid a,c-diamide synthase
MSRIFISAAHKSSGKTTVSAGLAAALTSLGETVQTFKKGPDYIDPMWLSRASGRPCFNLDFNTQSVDEIQATYCSQMPAGGFGVIEGNKGLHDGIDVLGSDCSAAVAKLLQAPVVLVIDAGGITRGVAPLVMGMRDFDRDVMIAGVILNQVAGPRQESKLRQAMEYYTDIPVFGAIGRDSALAVVERHLGLTTPGETAAPGDKIATVERAVRDGVDLELILAAGRAAPPVTCPQTGSRPEVRETDVTIGVARDGAFNFYYPDDLAALERAGARLEFFSPISDERLPEADGLFIGGGFPETHMAQLERNGAMRSQVLEAATTGMPIYAECGGLMYLARSIDWHGEECQMVGFIPGRIEITERPQGRGLMVLEYTGQSPWPAGGGRVSAHEFHYAHLVDLEAPDTFAWKVRRGQGIDGAHDGIVQGNVVAGFAHQRDTASNRWAERFVSFVRACKAEGRPVDQRPIKLPHG